MNERYKGTKMNPNPVNKFGDRNYQCRLYEQCKKDTLEKHWTFWTCAECEHKLMGTAITLVARSAKRMPTTQYGKFQLVSKNSVHGHVPLLEKVYIAGGNKNERSKPYPFQFNQS